MDMRYADHAPACFGLGLTRGSLFTLLRDAYGDAARIHTGVCIDAVAEDGVHLALSEWHRLVEAELTTARRQIAA